MLSDCHIFMQVMLYNKRAMRSDALIGLSSVTLGAVTEAAIDGAAMVRHFAATPARRLRPVEAEARQVARGTVMSHRCVMWVLPCIA